jgi:hypothetical protein
MRLCFYFVSLLPFHCIKRMIFKFLASRFIHFQRRVGVQIGGCSSLLVVEELQKRTPNFTFREGNNDWVSNSLGAPSPQAPLEEDTYDR